MYEPYLMQIGMIDRTPRGRVAAPPAPTSISTARSPAATPASSK